MGLMGCKRLPLSVSRRTACRPVMMSDLGDMTMEMLKRLSGSMDQLSEQDLAKLKSLCDDVSSKASSISRSASTISSTPSPRSSVPPPARKSSGSASNAPMPAFVIGTPRNPDVEKDSDAFFGINDGAVDESGDPIKPKGAKQWQQPNKPKEPVAKPIEGDSKRFSKYLPDERSASVVKLATDESLFDEDTWNEEYKKVFGRLDPEVAMTDVESLNAPRGASADKNDSFRKVREVQANANSYATSDEYYAALSSAMNEWKRAKQAQGEIIGSAVSDRCTPITPLSGCKIIARSHMYVHQRVFNPCAYQFCETAQFLKNVLI